MSALTELDLHSVRHHEVETRVDQFLLGVTMFPVTIVCGRSERMHEIVEAYLRLAGFQFDRGLSPSSPLGYVRVLGYH